MTTGIYNTGYNDYFYNQYQTGNSYQTNVANNNQNINFTANPKEELLAKKKKYVEKDDGNIGFFKAAKNFVKGIGKFFTGMFTDEKGNFSLGQTLKTAAIAVGVGAVTVLTAGTAVPAMIAAAGIGISALGMGKAAINIATAETDAEAEAAWQSLGSNTTAGALALAGAKAVAKSSAGANAAEFEGVTGYFKAGKKVFKDSGKAIENSYTGLKKAYTSAPKTVEGKWNAVKAEAEAQYGSMADTVKGNYNKTVYGTKGKIDNEGKAIDKQIKDIEKQQAKVKDKKSSEYTRLEAKKADLQAKQQAREINQASSWEEANKTIQEHNNQITAKKDQLAKIKDKKSAEYTKLENEIASLEKRVKYEKDILSRRTGEAQHINNKINKKKEQIESIKKQDNPDAAKIAKLEKEIAELEARKDFQLPENITAEQVKTSNENLAAKRTAKEEAEAELAKVEAAKATEPNAEVAPQYTEYVDTAKTNLAQAKAEYVQAQQENAALNQRYTVQEGKGSAHAATEIGREAYATPAARWFTVGIAGRQFGISNPYSDFYSQLNAQEKEYFKSLPEDQKAALIAQYDNLVA
ncbi:MAG: hypothetical protein NC200_05720 [Candidatus Gastranaerophilales bacterium]|nr:hypothetical protein [Candidatus Gastranaerophilales bacterium]